MKNLTLALTLTLVSSSAFSMVVTYDTVKRSCSWVCVDGTKGSSKDVSVYGCGHDAKKGCEDHGGLVRFTDTSITNILAPSEISKAPFFTDEGGSQPEVNDELKSEDFSPSENINLAE